MSGVLPAPTLEAAKQGFSGPDTKWFSQDLKFDVIEFLDAFDPAVADRAVVEQLLKATSESAGSSRLLSWSISASSLHLRDYWPAGEIVVGRETA